MRAAGTFAVALLAAGLAVAAPGSAADAPAEAAPSAGVPSGWTLKGVVLFSRHGIRGPIEPARCGNDPQGTGACMDAIASRPWPDMGVSMGNLLPRGYQRVATLGRYYRAHYASLGVLPRKGCPSFDSKTGIAGIRFVSDTSERTVMTAGALMDGMFPGCQVDLDIEPTVYTQGPNCPYEPRLANEASLDLIGGSYATVARGELKRPLQVMNKVLGPFHPDGCAANGATAPCSLSTVPVTKADPGPIETADQPSEQFLMQYAAGFPVKEVAWGRLPKAAGTSLPKAITEVNAIHAFNFRAGNMPYYQARLLGSQPMSVVAEALSEIAAGKGAPVVVYVGHDNNILNIAGMLGFGWHLESYQPFQVPPGGAIAFELWQGGGGLNVRAVYYAQTIQQMRANAALSAAVPPATALLRFSGCDVTAGTCPWGRFGKIMDREIVPACLQ